ncbi:hypothetical protein SLE2022_240300 [Rubroshorea leprosula]
MGSLGEEDLSQMVRDYIELEPPISISMASSVPSLNHQHQYLSLQDILGKYTDEEAEIHGKVLMYVAELGTSKDQEKNLKKLMVMKLRADGYEASLCKTSWISNSNHSKVFQFTGVYEYVDVMMVEKDGRAKRVIVDLDFRSQFELPRPTAAYNEIINCLPPIFVGSEEKLGTIIPLLCSAAKESLKAKGLHIPPWRKAAYMQSKWLSKNFKKVNVSPELEEDSKREEKSGTASTCFPSIFSRGQLQFCLKP